MEIKSKIGPEGKMVFEECRWQHSKPSVEVEEVICDTLADAKKELEQEIRTLEANLMAATQTYLSLTRAFDNEGFVKLVAGIRGEKEVEEETKITLEIKADKDQNIRFERATVVEPFITSQDGEGFDDLKQLGLFFNNIKKKQVGKKIEGFFDRPPTIQEMTKALEGATKWNSGVDPEGSVRQSVMKVWDDVFGDNTPTVGMNQEKLDRMARSNALKSAGKSVIKRQEYIPPKHIDTEQSRGLEDLLAVESVDLELDEEGNDSGIRKAAEAIEELRAQTPREAVKLSSEEQIEESEIEALKKEWGLDVMPHYNTVGFAIDNPEYAPANWYPVDITTQNYTDKEVQEAVDKITQMAEEIREKASKMDTTTPPMINRVAAAAGMAIGSAIIDVPVEIPQQQAV